MTAPPSHQFLDHTGEVAVRLTAPTLADLFAEAGRALAALYLGAPPDPAAPRPAGAHVSISLQAPDPAALLVDWLNELIYHREVEGAVFTHFVIHAVDDRALAAEAYGPRGVPTALEIKAATLHEARVVHEQDALQAHVVLDV